MANLYHNRDWKILCWNIRGLNAEKKWNALKSNINETQCDIACIQETKREQIDANFMKNFCPARFDRFEFLPSVGASRGSLIAWSSTNFSGDTIFQNHYAQSIEFTSKLSADQWVLTNIYAPCTAEGRAHFLEWFANIDMPDTVDWLVLGDFNLIRYPENRNKPGGDINNMFAFNEALSNLGLTELPLHGQKYTWTNKQDHPLLQRLDWFFTSPSWATKYLGTVVTTLSRDTSDHVSCLLCIKINIPRAKVFRFENFWMEHRDFKQVMQHAWSLPPKHRDKAKSLMARLKDSRRILREWNKNLPNLSKTIMNTKQVISLLDFIKEYRDLTLQEWNFRRIIQDHLTHLLNQQLIYWKQTGTI